MASSTLTSKGQITIPAEIRRAMGLKTGDQLEFTQDRETGRVELRRKTGSFRDLMGIFKYNGPTVTIEEMNNSIADHLAAEDERIKREWREWKDRQP